ncbi:MAG: hypothetical protein RBU30_17225 [Polyangia bacterium]|jgi:hypothetical protein|nr:hypothetical protein [Polyangia bacterium]
MNSASLQSKEKGRFSLRLELGGRYSDKVQIASIFQEAYDVFDRLCETGVKELSLVYLPDFQVEIQLLPDFERAAREALAYKDALAFGRDIKTRVEGDKTISCPKTRAMVEKIHARN